MTRPRRGMVIPQGYRSPLSVRETEVAIKFIKDHFQTHLASALGLRRISAPVVLPVASGLNDELSGVERPVRFHVKAMDAEAEIVQSLAKWKRAALADYGFRPGEGLYADMNAIRPDETLDHLHSIYVDQWDWERVMKAGERDLAFLKDVVRTIYRVMRETEKAVCKRYARLARPILPPSITFLHSEELEARYPELSPVEREDAICKARGAVFVIGIGAKLRDGLPHDSRAADYDDWSTPTGAGRRGLNGDILVWFPLVKHAFELSSMGIRVDPPALVEQLKLRREEEKAELPYHRRLLKGELPQTVGGGIGQSRLCMFYLRKAHIGEVQAGLWPAPMIRACRKAGVHLL